MTRTFPGMFTGTDYAEIITELRAYGHAEQDIEAMIEAIEADDLTLSDVADYVQAMNEGDDDEAYMCAAQLGLI